MDNSKHLRIAGFLQILAGILSIVAIQFLLVNGNDGNISNGEATKAFGDLLLLYGADLFKIIAGILGIILANKKSLLTVILGCLLFLASLWNFVQVGNNMTLIIINIVLLAFPYYYLHNAYKVFKNK